MNDAAGVETPPGGAPAAPSSGGGFGDLAPRLLSAVVLVAAACGALWAGGDVFALFWLLAAFAVNWEWQRLVGEAPARVARVAVGGAGLAGAAAFATAQMPGMALLDLALIAAVVAILGGAGRRVFAGGGVAYAGTLVVAACLLRDSAEFGVLAIGWLFAVVWGTDIFAYFGGRLIGGPKLWPRISAGKTWSGTLVGVFSGALLGLVVARLVLGPQAALTPLFGLGLFSAALAQAGDLFESAIKRRCGVKDSSRLIPGHGGVMDRVDGFIFASGFAALFGALRADSAAAGLFLW
jgi:phosphatidate cytidylyltransferase